MIRIRHPQGSAVFKMTDSTTLEELQAFIADETGLAPVKTGYPPRAIDLSRVSMEASIRDPPLSLQRGEQLIVAPKAGGSSSTSNSSGAGAAGAAAGRGPISNERTPGLPTLAADPADGGTALSSNSAPSGQSTAGGAKSASVKDSEVHVRLATGEHLTLKVVPDDNSCLFHAVGLVFQQRTGDAVCTEMRQAVASGIRENSTDYPDVVLGMPREQYVTKMLDPKTWGGAIELSVLSAHFSTEIVSLDVSSGVSYRFGEGSGYPSRAFLVHSGIHYDALALLPSPDAPIEFGRTLFQQPAEGVQGAEDDVMQGATKLIADLKARHYHTDTANFTLKCGNCGAGLVGEKGASQHAMSTGHTDFREA